MAVIISGGFHARFKPKKKILNKTEIEEMERLKKAFIEIHTKVMRKELAGIEPTWQETQENASAYCALFPYMTSKEHLAFMKENAKITGELDVIKKRKEEYEKQLAEERRLKRRAHVVDK